MQLSRFLGLPVDAGSHPVGTVVDVRLTSGCGQTTPDTRHRFATRTDRGTFGLAGTGNLTSGGRSPSCGPKSGLRVRLHRRVGPIRAHEVGISDGSTPLSGKVSMTEKNSGPAEGVKGIVEDVKGKAKETVGTVTGRDDMVREGKAQQDKADAQQDAAKKEAEAEAARGGAKAAEERQKREQ